MTWFATVMHRRVSRGTCGSVMRLGEGHQVTGVDNLSAGSLAANLGSAHRHNGRDRGSCWWSRLSWGAGYAPASPETALSQPPRSPRFVLKWPTRVYGCVMWPSETVSLPMRLYHVKWYVNGFFWCIIGI
jgi:hypothetical protein